MIISKLLLELGLCRLRNARIVDEGSELRSLLLHFVAVFGVPPQHEVFLMTAHHQHGDEKSWFMKLIDACLDIVNRSAQAAFEARLFVQTELPLSFDDHFEMRLILLERAAHGLDSPGQVGIAGCDDFPVKPVDVGEDGFSDPDLLFGLPGIIAKQEILFSPSAFQQFSFDFRVQFNDRSRAFGSIAIHGHRGFAVQMDPANKDDTQHSDDADRRDFVG